MSMPAGDLAEVFDPLSCGEKAAARRDLRPLRADFARRLKTLLDEASRSGDVGAQPVEARAKTLGSFAREAGTARPLHVVPASARRGFPAAAALRPREHGGPVRAYRRQPRRAEPPPSAREG